MKVLKLKANIFTGQYFLTAPLLVTYEEKKKVEKFAWMLYEAKLHNNFLSLNFVASWSCSQEPEPARAASLMSTMGLVPALIEDMHIGLFSLHHSKSELTKSLLKTLNVAGITLKGVTEGISNWYIFEFFLIHSVCVWPLCLTSFVAILQRVGLE
jgi:hypothetical protein